MQGEADRFEAGAIGGQIALQRVVGVGGAGPAIAECRRDVDFHVTEYYPVMNIARRGKIARITHG